MHVVLIYRPEADEDPDNHEPFAGIEIGCVSHSKEVCEQWLELQGDEHADWHFCLMPV